MSNEVSTDKMYIVEKYRTIYSYLIYTIFNNTFVFETV